MSGNALFNVVFEVEFSHYIKGSKIKEDSGNSNALFGYDKNSENLQDNEDDPTLDRFVGPLLHVNNLQ